MLENLLHIVLEMRIFCKSTIWLPVHILSSSTLLLSQTNYCYEYQDWRGLGGIREGVKESDCLNKWMEGLRKRRDQRVERSHG